MAELVEEGAGLVVGQQCRVARRRLGHVEVVEDHGGVDPEQLGLADEAAHPGAATLGVAGVEVEQVEADGRIAVLSHLEDTHVGVVAVEVRALGEGQPVETVGSEEHAVLENPLGLEPRPERGQVDVVLRRAHLLRVVRPVVCLDREAGLGRERRLLPPRVAGGRRGHPGEHLADRGRRAGGVVLGRQLRVVGEAEQLGPLRAQPQDVERDLPGVVGATAAPPCPLGL